MPAARISGRTKLIAAIAAGTLELFVIWAFVSGLAARWTRQIVASDLQVTNLPPPPAKPIPPVPDARAAKAKPPAAAAPKAPTVVPSPRIALAAPSPAASAAGAAAAGSGSGAAGSGTGEGGSGSGNGGGGMAAQRIAGALSDRDYPRDAGRASGVVAIAFRVRNDGHVDSCSVLRSSGVARLDALTCVLVEQRFRYRPATDGAGTPTDSWLRTSFTWGAR